MATTTKQLGRPRTKTTTASRSLTKTATASSTDEAVTDIVKKKRSRPDLTEMFSPHTEPGEIASMLSNALELSQWPQIDTNDATQVEQRILQYHRFCIANDMKPDLASMALSMGVTRKTLWAWENGIDSNKPQSVRNALKKGREINEIMLSQMMQNGKINPVTGIFLLKNNHGYKDQQDVVITPNNPMADMDPSEARQRMLEALPESDVE